MLCDCGYPTYLLGTWVREQQALTLEEAVRRLTADPADFFGIRDRGRLQAGLAADIAIFDPATVGSANRGERRYDLPGGAKRMVMPSRGVQLHDRQRRDRLRRRCGHRGPHRTGVARLSARGHVAPAASFPGRMKHSER